MHKHTTISTYIDCLYRIRMPGFIEFQLRKKGKTAVCGSSIFVGWLRGRQSLVFGPPALLTHQNWCSGLVGVECSDYHSMNCCLSSNMKGISYSVFMCHNHCRSSEDTELAFVWFAPVDLTIFPKHLPHGNLKVPAHCKCKHHLGACGDSNRSHTSIQ